MPAVAARHKFSLDQYFEMIDADVLAPHDHVELIEGDIVEMSPQNLRHGAAVSKAMTALMASCPQDCYLRVQTTLPLRMADAPEPDIAIVRGGPDDHVLSRPTEIILIVEVSDSSLHFDRTEKVRLYARHTIPEYWVVNLRERVVEVYRDPVVEDYRTKATYSEGEEFTPLFNSELKIAVNDLMPSAPGSPLSPGGEQRC